MLDVDGLSANEPIMTLVSYLPTESSENSERNGHYRLT